jgi:hypothetical protein
MSRASNDDLCRRYLIDTFSRPATLH